MLVYYSPRYHIDIGTHVFPTIKYPRLFERLQRDEASRVQITEPQPASWEDVSLVHTPQYLRKLETGEFTLVRP